MEGLEVICRRVAGIDAHRMVHVVTTAIGEPTEFEKIVR